MSLAFGRSALDRAVAVLRAGVVARDFCRQSTDAEVAAVFERSFYLRSGKEFICIGEPPIGNGPTTLIVAVRVAALGLRQRQRAFVGNGRIVIDDVLFDFAGCRTWRAPPWPSLPWPVVLHTACADVARRTCRESPPDSLARAVFTADDTPLARRARPPVAHFESWLSNQAGSSSSAKADDPVNTGLSAEPRAQCLLDAPLSRGMTSDVLAAHPVGNLVGLGPGLTPSGDDFLMGALAALAALDRTSMHDALAQAVVNAAGRTSPVSASLLRAAAAGHVGEHLHVMVGALVNGDADAALATAARIGHTSGWDALMGAVVTARNFYRG
jgi:hypothetical protein